MVGQRIHLALRRLAGGAEKLLVELPAAEQRFRLCRAERRRRDGAQRDARLAAALAARLQGHGRGDRHRRVVLGAAREELDEGGAARRRERRHGHRGDQLARFERGLVVVAEERAQRQLAPAAGAPDLDAGVERHERHRRVLVGIGVRERAADRGHVADAHRCHATERLRENGQALRHERRDLGLPVRNQRAEADRTARRLDPVEPFDVAQAHETTGKHQALPHHRHQRGAARDDPGVVAVLLEEREHLVDGTRRPIVEGVHGSTALAAAWIDSTIL